MKACRRPVEPPTLTTYRQAKPNNSWEEMKDDPLDDGQQAYIDIKQSLVRGQRCLCAYCEIRIADGTSFDEISKKRHEQRVEHFHPKSDRTAELNWALHWPNLWAVCHGGSQRPPVGIPVDPRYCLEPLDENLSCDAFKDRQIEKGNLPKCPEGWIMAPDQIPAFPLLFQFSPEGAPEPHLQNCDNLQIPGNCYQDAATLVEKTIEHLNLGCRRLNRNRSIARAQLEKLIANVRKASPYASPQAVLLGLVRRLFSQNPDYPWPEYFSLVRWRLGQVAEDHLRSINYDGQP